MTTLKMSAVDIKAIETQRQYEFQKWIANGAYYIGQNFGIRYWTETDLATAFWKYMEGEGFATCPSCGNQPYVNRSETITDCGKTYINLKEGLFPKQCHKYAYSTVKTLNCCQHLYSFEQKRRYVKVYYFPDCKPEYAPFNPQDPDGSQTLAAYQQKAKHERIQCLQKSIAAMQRELSELQGSILGRVQ